MQPAALIRADSAPMALQFLGPQFGATMQYGFLSALRGSWNTTNPKDFRGYKVIYGHLSSPQDTTVDYVSDFCSGFITDTINRTFWGRPVGIAVDNSGKVYISSDEGNKFILVLTPKKDVSVDEKKSTLDDFATVFSNPSSNQLTVSATLDKSTRVKVILHDISGKEIKTLLDQNLSAGQNEHKFDVNDLTSGYYFVKITAGQNSVTKKIVVGK